MCGKCATQQLYSFGFYYVFEATQSGFESNLVGTEVKDYWHDPKPVHENDLIKLYWNQPVKVVGLCLCNHPDIVLWNKFDKSAYLIDVSIPSDGDLSIPKDLNYSDHAHETYLPSCGTTSDYINQWTDLRSPFLRT